MSNINIKNEYEGITKSMTLQKNNDIFQTVKKLNEIIKLKDEYRKLVYKKINEIPDNSELVANENNIKLLDENIYEDVKYALEISYFETDTNLRGLTQTKIDRNTPTLEVLRIVHSLKAHLIVFPSRGNYIYIKGLGEKNIKTYKQYEKHLKRNELDGYKPKSKTYLVKLCEDEDEKEKDDKEKDDKDEKEKDDDEKEKDDKEKDEKEKDEKEKDDDEKEKDEKEKDEKEKDDKEKDEDADEKEKDEKELRTISKLKSLKYFRENLLDRIEKITKLKFNKKERNTSNMRVISHSKPYKNLIDKFKKKRVETGEDISENMKSSPELYSGVCGLGNQCAFTDMTFLMCAIVDGFDLKWDQPHKAKRPVEQGDLVSFAFGRNHPLAGETIILEVESVLGVDQRESHWSDTGYTQNNSNSYERGCVLFKTEFCLGRWTASGTKIKQGFTIVKTNRQEWEILIDGEYKTL